MSEPIAEDLRELTRRAQDWYAETTYLRATELVRLDESAWGLLTPEWPRSYAHNGILLRADPGPERIVAWGEEVLGGAGLPHRYVMALCALSPQSREALLAAGYELQPELTMVRPATAGPLESPAGVVVELVDEPTVEPLEARMWVEEWLPGAEEESVRQLTGRRVTHARAGEFLSYVVRDPDERHPSSGDLAACLDLLVRGWAAEVDGVATLAAHRRKGYGDALLARAVETAADRGVEQVVLTALVEDWPQHWYARRGFRALDPTWVATRTPALP